MCVKREDWKIFEKGVETSKILKKKNSVDFIKLKYLKIFFKKS